MRRELAVCVTRDAPITRTVFSLATPVSSSLSSMRRKIYAARV